MDFYQLQTVSSLSFGKSGVDAKDYAKDLFRLGYKGGGFADENEIYSFPYLNNAFKPYADFVPFYGMRIRLNDETAYFDACLYIENEDGYLNLVKIHNLHLSTYGINDLKPYHQGLALVLKTEDERMKDEDFLLEHNRFFYNLSLVFEEDFFFGIEVYTKEETKSVEVTRQFVHDHAYRPLAFPKVLYLDKKDGYKKYRLLELISEFTETRKTVTEEELEESGPFFLLSPKVVSLIYNSEEIANEERIARKIHFDFLKKRGKVLSSGYENPGETLSKMARERLLERLKVSVLPSEYQKRLDYELSVIHQMNFDDYFLIVQDYVNYAKSNAIKVGPGRGSSCGSLVTYALRITDIDPLKYDLSFERFLNPYRKTMPDIDMDFEDDRRNEVVQYLRNRYGKEHVSQIITFHTLQLRGAIDAVGNVLSIPENRIKAIKNTLSFKANDFNEEKKTNENFRRLYEDPYTASILHYAELVFNSPDHISFHPSGVLVAEESVKDVLPCDENEIYTVGFEYSTIESMGFLKFDILSLSNLTFIKEIEDNILKEGKKIVNYQDYLDDPKVFKTLNEDKTVDIFQLESYGIRKAMKEIHPENIKDLSALLALYRPGPMENIPVYAERKNSHVPYTIKNKDLADILKDTYGIIIYQEQILQIAQRLAGYTLGEADLFRRAISKKDDASIEKARVPFIEGERKHGLSLEEASSIFELVRKFASYGFNKSHSYAYAFVTYQLLFYKTYYPSAFYLASLHKNGLGNDSLSEKQKNMYREIYEAGYLFSLPSLNDSDDAVSFRNGKYILGFNNIHGLNETFRKNILRERKEHGPFTSLGNFFGRISLNDVKENEMLSFIDSGALDEFGVSRKDLREFLPTLLSVHLMGITSDEDLPDFKKSRDEPSVDLFLREKNALGMVLSFKMKDLIMGKKKYPKLYLVSDNPYKSNGKTRLTVIDRFETKSIWVPFPVEVNKYDIISVNERHNGRYLDILALNKEEKKENV